MAELDSGYFVFSLDTELGTGFFDSDQKRAKLFSKDGSRERWAIHSLLDLMDEYNIHATWALVGHLFYEKCEHCAICPILAWQGKYKSYEEAYGTNHPLWYGVDVVDDILARGRHEIAFHGYTHKIFNTDTMSLEDASIEVQEWLRLASRKGISPRSITFPRGVAGYLDLMRENGFLCYRSPDPTSIWTRNRYFGRYLKTIDHLLGFSSLPLYTLNDLSISPEGMIGLPGSMHIKEYWWLEQLLDGANLHLARFNRVIKGIQKAGRENKLVHLWAHPWEFKTVKDIDKVRYIFEAVALEQTQGRLRSVTMNEMAEKVSR